MNRVFAHSGNFCRLLNITNQIAAEVAKRMCLCSLVSYVVFRLLYSMDSEKGCTIKSGAGQRSTFCRNEEGGQYLWNMWHLKERNIS